MAYDSVLLHVPSSFAQVQFYNIWMPTLIIMIFQTIFTPKKLLLLQAHLFILKNVFYKQYMILLTLANYLLDTN